MNDFWDQRFGEKEYAYGESPNEFFKQEILKLKPGKLLMPAEGEGRNAVFAATLGWDVLAFDYSIEAKKKAEHLARKNNVKIEYKIDSFDFVDFPVNSFDCIGLVFAHMHSLKRSQYHQKLSSFLKPGGKLIFEGFSKKQIDKNTGGPRNIEMLFSVEELENDFGSFTKLIVTEKEVALQEGLFHEGIASVIRISGKK